MSIITHMEEITNQYINQNDDKSNNTINRYDNSIKFI
jgi:hypothetical protein